MFGNSQRRFVRRLNIPADRVGETFAARWFAFLALICVLCMDLPAPAVLLAGSGVQMNSISEEVVAKARLHGSVRVIVQLRIADGTDDSREQRIIAAQQALLGELASVAHRVARSFTAVPMLALDVSYDALQVLARSAHVSLVDGDGLAAPMKNIIEGKD
jgi:hypothetical protein